MPIFENGWINYSSTKVLIVKIMSWCPVVFGVVHLHFVFSVGWLGRHLLARQPPCCEEATLGQIEIKAEISIEILDQF